MKHWRKTYNSGNSWIFRFVVIVYLLGCSIALVGSMPVCRFSNGLVMSVSNFYECYSMYYSGLTTYYGEPCISNDVIIELQDVPTTYYNNTTEIYKNLCCILLDDGYTVSKLNRMSFYEVYYAAKKSYSSQISSASSEEAYIGFVFPKYSVDVDMSSGLPVNSYYDVSDVVSVRESLADGKYNGFEDSLVIGRGISSYIGSISRFKAITDYKDTKRVSNIYESAENYYVFMKFDDSCRQFLTSIKNGGYINSISVEYDNKCNTINLKLKKSLTHLDRSDYFTATMAKSIIKSKAVYGQRFIEKYCSLGADEDQFSLYLNNLPSYLSTVNYYKDTFSTMLRSLRSS